MPLTDMQIRKAKAAEKPYKLTDGGGLHLAVSPAGGKVWRLRYEIAGKEKLLTIGPYPDISLQEAREARTTQKKLLREGKDPSAEKADRRWVATIPANVTFEHLAREWYRLNQPHWTSTHAYDVIHTLERDVFPKLGGRDIRTITVPEVLAILREIEDRPAIETATADTPRARSVPRTCQNRTSQRRSPSRWSSGRRRREWKRPVYCRNWLASPSRISASSLTRRASSSR